MGKRFNSFVDKLDNRIDGHLPQNAEAISRRRRALIVLGGIAATAALVAGGKLATEAFDQPDFSPSNVEHVVQPGETVWDIAGEVDNSDSIDRRDIVDHIQNMDANADVFEDGVLDQGEVVERPQSVK